MGLRVHVPPRAGGRRRPCLTDSGSMCPLGRVASGGTGVSECLSQYSLTSVPPLRLATPGRMPRARRAAGRSPLRPPPSASGPGAARPSRPVDAAGRRSAGQLSPSARAPARALSRVLWPTGWAVTAHGGEGTDLAGRDDDRILLSRGGVFAHSRSWDSTPLRRTAIRDIGPARSADPRPAHAPEHWIRRAKRSEEILRETSLPLVVSWVVAPLRALRRRRSGRPVASGHSPGRASRLGFIYARRGHAGAPGRRGGWTGEGGWWRGAL